MSESDDLRVRLARLDPATAPLDPVESPRAQDLLERTMSTPVITPGSEQRQQRQQRPRRHVVPVAAAAAAVLAVAGVAVGLGLRSSDHPNKTARSLTLQLPHVRPGGPGATCIRFDVAILKSMTTAFSGTATQVSDTGVTLSVDHWYAGGPADTVTLSRPAPGSPVALETGVELQQGHRYLVAATDGTVTGCGYSGAATAELEQAYADAFGG